MNSCSVLDWLQALCEVVHVDSVLDTDFCYGQKVIALSDVCQIAQEDGCAHSNLCSKRYLNRLCVHMLKSIHIYLDHGWNQMRTNIEIDDKLMNDVLKATGLKTKKEAVELGLKTLLRLKKQQNIRNLRGKLKWTGDLDDMRSAS